MVFNVIIKAEAHEDALAAFLYYEEKQQGLGEKFLSSLEKRYADIILHPRNYAFIDEDHRIAITTMNNWDLKKEKQEEVIGYFSGKESKGL